MMNFSHTLKMMDNHRVTVPCKFNPVYAAALLQTPTEPGSLEALQAYQDMAGKAVIPYPGPRQPHDTENWWYVLQMGMTISRRQWLRHTFCARVEFRDAVEAQYQQRPPMTKPYNLFTVWYVFIAGLPIDKISRDAGSFVAKYEIEGIISCADDHRHAALNAANAIFTTIEQLDELGMPAPDQDSATR